LQISHIPIISNKEKQIKHQRFIEISHLHPKKADSTTKKFTSKITRRQ
jgi:hypothetical protein